MEFGVVLPITPSIKRCGPITFACLAPTRFLASAENDVNLVERLAKALDGLAAITDQGDMWSSWLLSGSNTRNVLARVIPVDLHPSTFHVSALTLTRAGHIDVRIARIAEEDYEIAVTRSYCDDLHYVLEVASKSLEPSALE